MTAKERDGEVSTAAVCRHTSMSPCKYWAANSGGYGLPAGYYSKCLNPACGKVFSC